MSRVFGPLARYKLYERLDDNSAWQIDFSRPRPAVWRYVCEHYAEVQRRYGFDFMRGDMSHVQMRPEGIPAEIDAHYDLLQAVKRYIRDENGAHRFAYYAESFVAPAGVMSYGDEADHLEASEADVTLGNLQSMSVSDPLFTSELARYCGLAATRSFAPSFTVMTADKDDPRFDAFYLSGNALRLFVALFLGDMPSYCGLGFETRDPHPTPAPNEHYTKLFVFHEQQGPKATRGPYRWGRNGELFCALTRIRELADTIADAIRGQPTRWLIPPDPTGANRLLAWTQEGPVPPHLFVAHADTEHALEVAGVPGLPRHLSPTLRFTTEEGAGAAAPRLLHNGAHHQVRELGPGECRVYDL
jgi:hypothetical protein